MQESPIRLLLIEDDEVARLAVKRALAASGLNSRLNEATDFDAASQALVRGAVDCVLLDFHLPGGTGLELMQQARSRQIDVPIIVLTGQGDESLAVEMMKAGAADYLPKKLLSAARLKQSIDQALRLYQAERRALAAQKAVATQAGQLTLLAESTLGMHAAITVEETLALAAELGCKVGRARVAVVRLCGARAHQPLERRWVSEGEAQLAAGELERWEAMAWRAGREVQLNSADLDSPAQWQGTGRLGGVLAVPLLGPDRTPIGSLILIDPLEGAFEAIDSLMLKQLAKATVVAAESSRLYRESQHAVRARDDLLAVVSHDLRNPLGVVGLSAALLKPAVEGTKEVAIVERLERSVRRMTRLIDDLLDAQSIDGATLVVRPVTVAGAALLADALDSATQPASSTHRCKVKAGSVDITLRVRADPERMAQVLGNLIGNAVKFIGQAEGAIELGLCRDAGRACFSVTDTGPGIAPEHLPHVFTRHFRGADSPKGKGLGLYICRGIVEAHQGEIRVDSTLGQGTSVRFWLPLHGDAGQPTAARVGS